MPAGWAAAAGAAINAGTSYMNNQAAAGAAKANNANASELAGAQNTMLNQAESVANQPFQAYTGTLTAPMSGNQQQAYSEASANAIEQPGQADVAKGTGLLDSEQPWNANTAATYMNPYTQDVTNAALANQNKSYLQSMAQLQTGEGATSSFGNSRNAIEEGDLTANNTLNVGTTTANSNAAAYNSAMSAWQQDTANKTSAANAYMNAGQDVTQMNSSDISNLLQTGGVSQVIAQTDLSNQYAQFMRQQGWSAQQLQSLVQGVGTAKGNGQVSAPVQSNLGNSILGLGSTLAGLYGGGSTNTSVPSSVSSANDSATNELIGNVNSGDSFGAGSNINVAGGSAADLDLGDGG